MQEPKQLIMTLTMPRHFTFTPLAWTQLGTQLGEVCAASTHTYLISHENESLLIQEINPPVDVSEALQGGILMTRTQLGYELTSHAACGTRGDDHMTFALLIHAASGGKVKVSANVRSPEAWAQTAAALLEQAPNIKLPPFKVGNLKARA